MQNKNNLKKIVAVTGGIGSGKTFATTILKNLGFKVFSCDETANYILKKYWVLKKIKKSFPKAVKGYFKLTLDKKEISKIIFNDKSKLKELNDITHPLIIKQVLNEANKCKDNIVFIEFPLLFEGNYQNLFSDILIIERNIDTRIESVMKRSNLSKDEVLSRINSQFNYELLDKNNFYIINNDSDEKNLTIKLQEYIEFLNKKI